MFFSVTLLAQPAAPQNLTANSVKYEFQGNSKIVVKLDWDKVKDSDGSDVPLYEVFKKDGDAKSSNSFSSIGEILWRNSKIDGNVEKGKTYTYYVVAKNKGKQISSPSNYAEVTVSDDGSVGVTTATVAGKVTDEITGNGIENVFVTLFNSSTLVAKTVITDNNGDYSISVLAGEFIVYFKAPQDYFHEYYDNAPKATDATFLVVSDGENVSGIDAALTPISSLNTFTLSGNVSDSEGNTIEAKVDLMLIGRRNSPRRHYTVTTDKNGDYSFEVKEGSKVIVFAKPMSKNFYGEFYNDSFTMANAERISITGNVENINFVLDGATEGSSVVSGTVLAEESSPIDAMIMAIKLGTPRYHRASQLRSFVDDDGNYSFDNLSAGDYIFFCIPEDGYLPSFYKEDGSTTLKWKEADIVTLDNDETITNINFVPIAIGEIPIDGFAEIHGNVTDQDGHPVSDAYVYIVDGENNIVSYSFTNSEGRYNATDLTPGYYSVIVDNYGFNSEENDNVYTSTDESGVADFNLSDDALTDVENEGVINEFKLNQNYPNPFNPTTTIKFSVMGNTKVELKVYDIIGKEIKTLINRELNAGSHSIQFDASNLPSGIYIYEIRSGNFLQSRKMLLLK